MPNWLVAAAQPKGMQNPTERKARLMCVVVSMTHVPTIANKVYKYTHIMQAMLSQAHQAARFLIACRSQTHGRDIHEHLMTQGLS
jgi:hypothetical protein